MDDTTEISFSFFFRGFNASKFVLYGCLLSFAVLLALQLDHYIQLHFAFIFLPLWICTGIVVIAAITGVISFVLKPPSINDIQLRVDFAAMLLTTIEHVILCSFEVLIFYKLEYAPDDPQFSWIFVFTPLFCLSIFAISLSIWAIRHDKPFELELFFSINIVQFVFIAFKLDQQIDWGWAVVFIPLWVVLSLSVVGVLYALILAVLLARSRHLLHRRHHLYSAVFHTLLVIPALVCLVLLTGKLEALHQSEEIPYTVVITPLAVSLFCMMLMACGSRGGNIWWFGLRAPVCTWLLAACPCIRVYANVSYRIGAKRPSSNAGEPPPLLSSEETERGQKQIVQIRYIESPD
ncbi:unnamed protein product, partial [Mesorhabditis belari]|uniref:Uncharacterized protein n=1 Tax=Mesorhabditis belari TaxID=2138241 RepID=A0AAF3FCH7_9BILA